MNEGQLGLKDENGRHRRRVAKRLLALILVLGLVGMSGYALYLKSVRPSQPHQTIHPFRATIRQAIIANGTIVPRKEVNVKPQISGVIQRLMVDRGDAVKVGDLIAVIRPLPDPGDVNAAEGELRNARLGHLRARQDFERVEALVKRNAASREEYEKLWTELRLAEQRLTTAQRRLEIVQTGASAALGRSASEVRATISGMVLERPVEIGTFVIETNTFNEGTTIVAIADMSDLTFRGKVDEPDAGSLRVGMPVSVTIGAFAGERFEGRLEFIAPKAVEKDGLTTFEIRAGLARKADRFVRAGYSATADIVVARREEVLALPERYVHFQDGQPYVMIETAPGRFEPRTITLGLSDGITTEVTSGLSEDDRVQVE
jgi:HlyD family secretion protein